MDLVTHITGIANSASFTPGAGTPSPYNIAHTGLTNGTSPATASKNMAEIYNRWLLTQAAVITEAGLTIDNTNWTQMANAITTLASAGSGSSSNTFNIIAVAGQTSVTAETTTDTLTLVAGTNVTITTDATLDTITINASSGSGLLLTNFTGLVLPYANLTGITNPGQDVWLTPVSTFWISRYITAGEVGYTVSQNSWNIFSGAYDLLFIRGADGIWYQMTAPSVSPYTQWTVTLADGVMPVQIAGAATVGAPTDPGTPGGGPY